MTSPTNGADQPALLFLHAHPDDECILTGATMARAAAQGLRTIVVYGTRGDAGETNADLGDETLGERRVAEAEAACDELGVARVIWLDHADSGMADTETTNNPDAFCNTDPDEVSRELTEALSDEDVFAIIGYDDNGTYGHPDHKQIYAVAHAAAEPLGATWVLDATYNREYLASLPDADGSLDPNFAAAEADLTHFVSGEQWLEKKLAALANHRSQIPDDWDTENPDIDGFRARFGTEWFIVAPAADTDEASLGPLTEVLEPKAAWQRPTSPAAETAEPEA